MSCKNPSLRRIAAVLMLALVISGCLKETSRERSSAPTASDQQLETAEDTAVQIALQSGASYQITRDPANGQLSGTAPNLVYTPNTDFHGTDEFSYTVVDSGGKTSSATVSIVVAPVNDAPRAHSRSASAIEDTSIGVLLGGSDPEGDPLTFSLVTGPGNGTLSGQLPNAVFTPHPNFSGSDWFSFTVNDGNSDSAAATVTITVQDDNDDVFCGDPVVDRFVDAGGYLWRDCDGGGRWFLRVHGGGSSSQLVYRGRIEAPGGLTDIEGVSLEAGDTLDDSSDPTALSFVLAVQNFGMDGADFDAPYQTCFEPDFPAGVPLYLGGDRALMESTSIALDTGIGCQSAMGMDIDRDGLSLAEEQAYGTDPENADSDGGGVTDGDEVANGTDPTDAADDMNDINDACGDPGMQPGTDRGTFLWRACDTDNRWSLRVIAGDAPLPIDYRGEVRAPGGAQSVTPVAIGSPDDIDQSLPHLLQYAIETEGSAIRGFDFSIASNQACFRIASPTGSPVFLGRDRTVLSGDEFDLTSGGPCPLLVDADNDGLSDAEEVEIGTDPNNADTDGGSIADLEELVNGTNPLDGDDDVNEPEDACGEPSINNRAERGTFLWHDCVGGDYWYLRVTGGGTPARIDYEGRLFGGGPIGPLHPFNLEPSDLLEQSMSPAQLDYRFIIYNNGLDGMDFVAPPGTCYEATSPENLPVYLGANKVPMTTRFVDLESMRPCEL